MDYLVTDHIQAWMNRHLVEGSRFVTRAWLMGTAEDGQDGVRVTARLVSQTDPPCWPNSENRPAVWAEADLRENLKGRDEVITVVNCNTLDIAFRFTIADAG